VLESVQGWIQKHLRLEVNASKSGVGKSWERKFLGYGKCGGVQSRTSNQLRDAWRKYVRGWWGYYRLAENRRPIFRLEGWIRRISGHAFGCGAITR
jgi:RNA-directed DNA polymerase